MTTVITVITYVCLILGIVGVAFSAWLFKKNQIFKVWSSYTGRTQQKELEAIRANKGAAAKVKIKNVPDAERASAADVDQIWSESKVLSDMDDDLGIRDDNERDETALIMSTQTGLGTEAQKLGETELIYDEGTEILTHFDPETEVLPEELASKMMMEAEITAELLEKKPDENGEAEGDGGTEDLGDFVPVEPEPEQDLSSTVFELEFEEAGRTPLESERIVK